MEVIREEGVILTVSQARRFRRLWEGMVMKYLRGFSLSESVTTNKELVGKKFRYSLVSGYLEDIFLYNAHKRAKNWMAVIEIDPRSPGGLKRRFLDMGRGEFFYYVADLEVGDPVEVGADYYTGSWKRVPGRAYAVVVGKGSNWIEFLVVGSAKEAVELGMRMKKEGEKEVEDNPLKDFSDDELIKELERRGYRVVRG